MNHSNSQRQLFSNKMDPSAIESVSILLSKVEEQSKFHFDHLT